MKRFPSGQRRNCTTRFRTSLALSPAPLASNPRIRRSSCEGIISRSGLKSPAMKLRGLLTATIHHNHYHSGAYGAGPLDILFNVTTTNSGLVSMDVSHYIVFAEANPRSKACWIPNHQVPKTYSPRIPQQQRPQPSWLCHGTSS